MNCGGPISTTTLQSVSSLCCAQQTSMHVVEALLIAIYLPEGKDVYIHIRPTLLLEAISFSCLYTAEPSAVYVMGVHVMGMSLTGVHLMGDAYRGGILHRYIYHLYLINVHLMGVHRRTPHRRVPHGCTPYGRAPYGPVPGHFGGNNLEQQWLSVLTMAWFWQAWYNIIPLNRLPLSTNLICPFLLQSGTSSQKLCFDLSPKS